MSDPFVHLQVASGYSLRYGAAHPRDLVARAADYGMDTLALTDRDGLYGAIRFVTACASAGLRPVLGVDLAVRPLQIDATATFRAPGRGRPRTPARGGAYVEDPLTPRVIVLGVGRSGYSQLCRLVSATHLSGRRGQPVSTLELISEHAAGGDLVVLLGPASELGRALARGRSDLARAHLARWRAVLAVGDLQLAVVHHRGPGHATLAGRLTAFAHAEQVGAVLTNAVRYLDPADAPIADVLDAARRLVPLDLRHIERANAQAHLKSGKQMMLIAEEVIRHAGVPNGAWHLLARTRLLADRCAVDPRADLGIGELHFPELDVGGTAVTAGADAMLRARCEAGLRHRGLAATASTVARLDDELAMIRQLGYASYFLTVADVTTMIHEMGVRCAARGSGAGSIVTYLTGVSDVDPIRYGLLVERFLSPLRHELPDVDLDVESARRTEVYEQILARYGGERVACVAMMDTYRARHALRDTGAALGLPPGEIDTIAKAFPHIRAGQIRAALRELPELRASWLTGPRLDLLFRLAERLDGLPRHIALHPCGVLLSDRTLLDRSPVEASFIGFPMSQYDKDDVEALGLLKLDVLGIRMQSAISHALGEVARVDGTRPDIDAVPRDDPATFALVQSTKTLGCFQIESPGQRELVGKFAPETFEDLIVDISLFRPGPVKSDMVRPFLAARQGWTAPTYPHPDLTEVLEQTYGVVVFHEQVLQILAQFTGCTLAEADEVRRALGDPVKLSDVHTWFMPAALGRGYELVTVDRVWEILRAFGSFGFCKAHAAAFALPTYQSAWLKAHHTAAFLAGVLTHDPGMYPKRLILDDARQFGIAILPLDVNASDEAYRVERVSALDEPPPEILDQVGDPLRCLAHAPRERQDDLLLPDARGYGIRLGFADVKGISAAEIARLVDARPYASLSDCWYRAAPSQPIAERLVLAGGFDSIYGLGFSTPVRRRGKVTRRDLLMQIGELDRSARATIRATRTPRGRRAGAAGVLNEGAAVDVRASSGRLDTRVAAAAQSQAVTPPQPVHVQLALDLGGDPGEVTRSGLPEMTGAERVRAELDILGMDASAHVLASYADFFCALGVTPSRDLLRHRNHAELLVAGVKVATQTPPIRSGRRVVFLTLDDATGPVDVTLFEDVLAGYAATVFHSWLLVVRGRLRRTGPRGRSLLALGCWELPMLYAQWRRGGVAAVHAAMAVAPGWGRLEEHLPSGPTRPVEYPTGFRQHPYSDIRPSGSDPRSPPRKLWHASPGSSGQ